MARVAIGTPSWGDDLNADLDQIEQNINTHKAASGNAHAASAISVSPIEGISAPNVQGALAEIASEYITKAEVAASQIRTRIVRAKNDSGQGTAATLDGAVVPGCTLIVPPTDNEVELTWGAAWSFNAISQGLVNVGPYEFTEGFLGAGVIEVVAEQVLTNHPVTQLGPIVRGSAWVAPSDVTRVFVLAASKAYDGGSETLDAYVRNGTTVFKSWIAARY